MQGPAKKEGKGSLQARVALAWWGSALSTSIIETTGLAPPCRVCHPPTCIVIIACMSMIDYLAGLISHFSHLDKQQHA